VAFPSNPLLNPSLIANKILVPNQPLFLSLFIKKNYKMRMPFTEFLSNGDLKFVIVFIVFLSIAVFHFIKKLRNQSTPALSAQHNLKINRSAFWILILSVLSLLLGLMHSFYFIGKAGGVAPNLIFQGVANALITPVLGLCLFMICKIFSGLYNTSRQTTLVESRK
jgi:phosphoglycerol transferase MdoB-like AlkP superfamily enzyme